jgi:hypothetical protein
MKQHRIAYGEHSDFAEAVLAAWRQGHDTADIAARLQVAEHRVANLIAAEQDRRHEARKLERAAS